MLKIKGILISPAVEIMRNGRLGVRLGGEIIGPWVVPETLTVAVFPFSGKTASAAISPFFFYIDDVRFFELNFEFVAALETFFFCVKELSNTTCVCVCVHVHVCVWSFISPHIYTFGFIRNNGGGCELWHHARFFLFIFRQSFWFIVSLWEFFFFFKKREGKGYFSFLIHFGFVPPTPLPPPFLLSQLMIYTSSRFNVQHGIYIYTLFTPRWWCSRKSEYFLFPF